MLQLIDQIYLLFVLAIAIVLGSGGSLQEEPRPVPPMLCPGIKEYTNCAPSCRDSCETTYDTCTFDCDTSTYCVCPKGTIELAPGSEFCVEPSKCPSKCPGNKVYTDCASRCIDSCEVTHESCTFDCDTENHCVCPLGMVESTTGSDQCVKISDCPPKCPGNKVYTDCASTCIDSCEVRHEACTFDCDTENHCVCPPGMVESTIGSDQCVKISDCPPKCPGNKVYTDCASRCIDSCEVRHEACTFDCDTKNNCVCPPGMVESTTGSDQCVKISDCPEQPECSYLLPKRRVDCGGGLGKENCEEKGCCWDRSIRRVNWCFYKDQCVYTSPENRIDCGRKLGKERCEAKGCCWDNSIRGVKWCFYKTAIPPPPKCSGDKVYKDCASTCIDSCEVRHEACTFDCDTENHCVCPPGTVELTTGSDKCVKISDCPTKCPGDKVYTDCAPSCINSCEVRHEVCTFDCDTTNNCVCPPGTVELTTGSDKCVKISACPNQPQCSSLLPERRVDCGRGLGKAVCESKGCCWDNSKRGYNWCFYKDVCVYINPENRVDCGRKLGKAKCEAKGCCWDDKIRGVNWCFYKTAIPPPPSKCPGDKVYTKCASTCQNSCEVEHEICTADCDPTNNCECPPGTVELTTGSDKCVKKSDCPKQPECSYLHPDRRVDCGGRLGKARCEARGCCWDDSMRGYNWCFFKDICTYTNPENRIDCGKGLGKARCEAKGCCWDDSIRGVKWCFHKTVIEPKCPGNKVVTQCASSCRDSCEVKHEVCTADCDPTTRCVCPIGMVELKTGSDKCVKRSDCPKPKCPGDKVYTKCASSCQNSCEVEHEICTADCDPTNNCECPPGTVELTTGSDKCVKKSDCPRKSQCSNLLPERRVDCGKELGKARCEALGCCWDRRKRGYNRCFYKSQCDYTNPRNRVDCGGGLGKSRCERKGCCWDDSIKGVKWCFHKTLDYGRCPAPSATVPVCIEACRSDADCKGGQSCCNTGCGHRCMDPYY